MTTKKMKIILWIDTDFMMFGLAKSLQEQYDCELYAVIDITSKGKKFFEKQKFVNFKKVWYYHDYIKKLTREPDYEYLSKFENNNKINLWLIAQNERVFYDFNNYYKFSTNEILLILEQECKLFENILKEVNPDFLFSRITDLQHNHIFYQTCNSYGIKCLMLWSTKLGFKSLLVNQINKELAPTQKLNNELSLQELQAYQKENNSFKKVKKYQNENRNSSKDLIRAAATFLFSSFDANKTHYPYYGRTKFKVIFKEIIARLKRRYRESYINKLFIDDISNFRRPFVYFPLHANMDRVLLIGAPFYTNQIEIIKNIVKSLPIDYELYVKEHPILKIYGWRKISYYQELKSIPRVKLIHPSLNPEEIIKKSSLIISISGTAGLEAAFQNKPSIVLVEQDYSFLDSVKKINNFSELPSAIKNMIGKTTDISGLNQYVDYIQKNSFDLDWMDYNLSLQNKLLYGGNLADIEIPLDLMKSFLEEQKQTFDLLAKEHIKKINEYSI
jgi:hypothetical protein